MRWGFQQQNRPRSLNWYSLLRYAFRFFRTCSTKNRNFENPKSFSYNFPLIIFSAKWNSYDQISNFRKHRKTRLQQSNLDTQGREKRRPITFNRLRHTPRPYMTWMTWKYGNMKNQSFEISKIRNLVVWISFSAKNDQRNILKNQFWIFEISIFCRNIGNIVWELNCLVWQSYRIVWQSNCIELHRMAV